MKKTFNFSFLNLGCTKNLVDTQYLMGNIFSLWANNPNYEVQYIADPYDPETKFVFLNTCGFIKAGRDEMMATIEKLTKAKKKIYLLWCGLQYFKTLDKNSQESKKFKTILTNVHLLSRTDRENINIANLMNGVSSKKFEDFDFPKQTIQAYTNAEYKFEYLKIAEGCDNKCTFCIIPKIRGAQKSLPIDTIIQEVKNMVHAGIKEIIFIAQDTTRYGTDLYKKPALFRLLKKVEEIQLDFKYRLLYLYPDIITIQQLKKLSKFKKFIPYFDIPFQHISSHLLKRMGRFYDEAQIYAFLDFIKKQFPNSFIRTNFIIGFPGETEKDQKKLLWFINHNYFDNIALFEYHDEPLATSSKLDKKIPDDIIRKRFTEVRQLVNSKLLDKEEKRKYIGRPGKGKKRTGYVMDIIHTSMSSKHSGLLVVRPELHAPEIDPYDEIYPDQIIKVHNKTGKISIGEKITYKL